MIKFKAEGEDGTKMLCFGITKDNVEDLVKEGKPIFVSPKDWSDAEDGTPAVCVFYGHDENILLDSLLKQGVIDGKTMLAIKNALVAPTEDEVRKFDA